MIEIRQRYTNKVLYSVEAATLAGAVEKAVASGADLYGADLEGADLARADLTGANLTGAKLARARLEDADLEGADLEGANLAGIRDDVRAVLDTAAAEVPGLLAALRDGRIDGSTYSGGCSCLIGTIAHVRGVDVASLPKDCGRPAERWFLAIRPGMLPSSSPVVALTERWIVEYGQHIGDRR